VRATNDPPVHGWFDAGAENYAQRRPAYPAQLFRWIAEHAPDRNRVWDVACGSGQASLGLAEHFEHVEATDLSPGQIAAAPAHPRVHYQVAAAERSSLKDQCLDAIVVAAAIHWLDVPTFNREALRTLRPHGLMVWMGYEPLQGAPTALQSWLDQLYHQRLQEWWPPQRRHVDSHYADLPFPGPCGAIPADFKIPLQWDCDDLAGFIGTWSALRQARQRGRELLPELRQELQEIWPQDQARLRLHLPIMGRWGHLNE